MKRERLCLAALLAAAAIAAPAAAQTTTTTTTTTSSGSTGASGSTSTSTTSTGTTSTAGAYDKLSPGQQKIAHSLFEAQQPSATGPAPLSLDQIAAMKQGTGWGQVFKQMKSEGLVGDAKNLGQVVSGHAKVTGTPTTVASSTGTSTTVTTASGGTVGSGGPHSSTGDAAEIHGNSAHVTQAHATNAAAGGGSGSHGNGASNGHAH